jgi:hypothetical protein
MTTADHPNPHLDNAAVALTRVLAHDGLDLSTRLAVAAALATLDDVQPPPPPLPGPIAPLHPGDGIPRAHAELRLAIANATDPDQALRAGLAARELLDLHDQP